MATEKKTVSKSILRKKDGYVLSTGGGEPIPKGAKWTTEDRDDEAPRDRDGKFETKSSIGEETKYPQHAWRGTYAKGSDMNPERRKLTEDEKKDIWEKNHKKDPMMAGNVRAVFAKKIPAGSKFVIDNDVYVTLEDIDTDDFVDGLRTAWKGPDGETHFGNGEDVMAVAKRGVRTEGEKKAAKEITLAGKGEVGAIQAVPGESISSLKMSTPQFKSIVAQRKAELQNALGGRQRQTFARKKSDSSASLPKATKEGQRKSEFQRKTAEDKLNAIDLSDLF